MTVMLMTLTFDLLRWPKLSMYIVSFTFVFPNSATLDALFFWIWILRLIILTHVTISSVKSASLWSCELIRNTCMVDEKLMRSFLWRMCLTHLFASGNDKGRFVHGITHARSFMPAGNSFLRFDDYIIYACIWRLPHCCRICWKSPGNNTQYFSVCITNLNLTFEKKKTEETDHMQVNCELIQTSIVCWKLSGLCFRN